MEKNSSKDKGTVLWRFSQKFQFAADKIIPDSLVFCLILTFIVYVAALIFTDRGPVQLCLDWYNHAWDMLAFSMQMSMMVVVCAACAKSRPVNRAMGALAKALRNPIVAVVVFMIWGYIASFINWAFCTLSCTVLAIELSKRNKGLSFPILLVGGYCTSCLGQCLGPTASVYALLATEGNYMQETLDGILSQDVTVYNPVNLTIWIILALVTILLIVFTRPPKDSIMTLDSDTSSAQAEAEWEKIDRSTPAGVMNSSKIIMWLIGVAGIIAIVHEFATKGFLGALSLNFIIFFFLIVNCFLYPTPTAYVGAHKDSMHLATEVMIQFPFYAGIAGIMTDSGLAAIIVSALVGISTAKTLPIWSYISASVVNLFIPSQGGQFIVQGPLLMDAAQQLGADKMTVINAFVYGDEATNLLQPLYILPGLAMVGVKLKDVWGIMAFVWFFWTIFTILGFAIVPGLLL